MVKYVQQLEAELRARGVQLNRPKPVMSLLKIQSIREGTLGDMAVNGSGSGLAEERPIIDSLTETVLKSMINRN